MSEIDYDEFVNECWNRIPDAKTAKDVLNIRIAARLAWEKHELGSLEAWQFAYCNNTPIVPAGHPCHPHELVKRGFVDGVGWPKKNQGPKITTFKWPDGSHFYASVDGDDVQDERGNVKWNSEAQAVKAAEDWIKRQPQK